MLVALSYHSGDHEQAARLANWIAELGGCKGHSLLLLRESSASLIPKFAESFDKVTTLEYGDDRWNKWPESCNHVFQKTARYIAHLTPQPWLWLEPDAVPLKAGWLDAIQAEYVSAKKPFMGDRVTASSTGEQITYMSGIGVYPAHVVRHAGEALMAREQPFDTFARRQILGQMHKTLLIQHVWKRPTFESMEDVRNGIRPEAVLYHASKDGSLIARLRDNLSGVRGLQATLPSPVSNRESTGDLDCHLSSVPLESVEVIRHGEMADAADLKPAGENRVGSNPTAGTLHTHSNGAAKPWQSRLESNKEIARLCKCLKEFCDSPAHTNIVRQELVYQRVFMPKHIRRPRTARQRQTTIRNAKMMDKRGVSKRV